MQTTHFWNKLDLHRRKIISGSILILFILLHQLPVQAQGMFGLTSSSGSDEKLISYGFFLAGHHSTFRVNYSDAFVDPNANVSPEVRAIFPRYSPGFSLGFIGMLRFHDQVQMLFTPKVGFYEYKTEVHYFNDQIDTELIGGDVIVTGENRGEIITYNSEATMVELPLLFKYRSQRFNNTRMYFLGGASYQFRTKTQEEANLEELVTTGQDYTIELGMGFEIYFKYFKFAPEIRFSHGLNNLYQVENTQADFRDAISSIKRKNITIYLNFQ
ncbi:outer membrane beta-barrel protein [Algoriphagus sp.]|uniref:type IX secretion/gliding motility protein PorT/SprT n=1 Tax=Algoriphagus sp. TaxID=1872435 RepID=UPI00261B2816|nr:outer membrane beta-barrel protein [Algoriphagus sp.]